MSPDDRFIDRAGSAEIVRVYNETAGDHSELPIILLLVRDA
jgi:hypothetical protein